MLAFCRQHHQEIAAVLTDLDATERRITELYTKAMALTVPSCQNWTRPKGGGSRMLLDGHVISTGADGRLVGMTSDDVTALMSRALRSDRVVMHFHGGLVDEARGMKIAQHLLPVYTGAGAYPVFFVWRSGALEILRDNLFKIAREELFDRLVRRVLGWAVGKVRGEEEGSRGAPIQQPSQQELDEQLGARKRLTDLDADSEPFADEQVTP
jgi:hypothetical protein